MNEEVDEQMNEWTSEIMSEQVNDWAFKLWKKNNGQTQNGRRNDWMRK